MDTTVQSSLVNHPYTSELRDSGYSNNLYPSKMSSAWLDKCYGSDMKRTEYRLQYNTRKAIQYTGPTFNTGFLKQKEHNYKYTEYSKEVYLLFSLDKFKLLYNISKIIYFEYR